MFVIVCGAHVYGVFQTRELAESALRDNLFASDAVVRRITPHSILNED